MRQADVKAGQLEAVDLPFGVTAVTISDFIWDRDSRLELAVATDDGSVNVLARGKLDTQLFSRGSCRASASCLLIFITAFQFRRSI